jgi:hypothetical protein
MKKITCGFIVVMILSQNIALASFKDVSESYYLHNSINWLKEQGIVEGYSDGTFKPNNLVNRAEFLKMIYETIGMKNQKSSVPFSDFKSNEWYSKYIIEAYADGIIQGYSDNTFRPEDKINFAEALKIIGNAFLDVDKEFGNGSTYTPCKTDWRAFNGVDTNTWYWKYVYVLDQYCILDFNTSANVWELRGTDPVGYLIDKNPGAYVNRAEMAEIIYRTKAVRDFNMEKFLEYKTFPFSISKIEKDSPLCLDGPFATDIGFPRYPVSESYSHLSSSLGEIFTAYECGGARLENIWGVEDGAYILGLYIKIADKTSILFTNTLKSSGFICNERMPSWENCKDWVLTEAIELKELLKLRNFSKDIIFSDCINCG